MVKAEAPFVGDFKDETPSTSSDSDMAFFPQLPVIRSRGSYRADRVRKEKICTKHTTSHPSLLPGVFVMFCQHGICYGFEIMRVSESPNTAFCALFCRFQNAPSTVIYDNACTQLLLE